MRDRFIKSIALAAIAIFLGGCCDLDSYKNFAKSGIAHTERLEKAVAVAETAQVDATSWKILGLDQLKPFVTATQYLEKAEIDRERIAIYGKLREHNVLLKAYFSALSDLANSDAPEQGGKALDGLAKQINELGNELRGSSLFKDEGGLIASLGKAIFQAAVCGALEDHFKTYAKTLEIEVATQELLCQTLSKSAASDLRVAAQQREFVQLIPSINEKKPLEKPEEWAKKRAEIYQMYKQSSDLQQASASAKGLRLQFEAIAGKTQD